MLKKLIAASAAFAFFACSNPDDGNNPSSSSQSVTNQSSSGTSSSSEPQEPTMEEVKILIASFNSVKSAVFGTWGYGYTLKDGAKENLTQFWLDDPDCPTTSQNKNPPDKCEKDKTNAILQNKLTNRDSDLHYKVDGIGTYPNFRLELTGYKLTGEGDQAALGLNVGDDESKNIGQTDNHKIDGAIAFTYTHKGGAHIFRAAASDDDFWYKNIPASTDETEVKVYVRDLEGMGSKDETPFVLTEVSKFLWVVEYDAAGTNQGTLMIDDFNAVVERAVEE